MNIFVLDKDPTKAAQMLCDAHVVKMIVESCQLLSTHDRLTERFYDPSGLYKATHVHHPCRLCLDNLMSRTWLICHLYALLNEYYRRYGKVHKSASLYTRYYCNTVSVPEMAWKFAYDNYATYCSFPKCMPDEFKVGDSGIDSVIQSYRNYYKHKQQTMKRFRYTKREMPEWLKGDNMNKENFEHIGYLGKDSYQEHRPHESNHLTFVCPVCSKTTDVIAIRKGTIIETVYCAKHNQKIESVLQEIAAPDTVRYECFNCGAVLPVKPCKDNPDVPLYEYLAEQHYNKDKQGRLQ